MNERRPPAVESLLQKAGPLMAVFGRPLTTEALRTEMQTLREQFRAEGEAILPTEEQIVAQAEKRLQAWAAPSLQPVINASGVLLHTNLGRAPLSRATLQAMQIASQGYTNLEFDLQTGKRGSRLHHAESVLQRLTGSEAAVVVNNCAAAVLLALAALAKGKQALIARSQLVEIGGGFRIPEVMKQSGVKLLEVGTTNKVRLRDYAQAIEEAASATGKNPPPVILLSVHASNFKISGFTEEPSLAEMARLAQEQGLLLMQDLGSGALLDSARYGLEHEPTAQEALAAGADLVIFSGDKLLGGPQAGIILGKSALLDKIKSHPLARALRADKTRLAGLNATLLHYLKDEAEREIPLWRMISQSPQTLQARAKTWKNALGQGEVLPALSTVGGGSLPGQNLPTWAWSIKPRSAAKMLTRLRQQTPPVIARIEDGRIWCDPRSVLPEEEPALLKALSLTLQ